MRFSFRKAWTIAARDYRSYFASPIAYIVIAGFLLIMGWMFFYNLQHFALQSMQYKQYGMGKAMGLTDGVIRPLYGNMNVVFLFLVPFITMRLFAEERKLQSLPLLMTAPLTLAEVIAGKFLSAVLLVITMLAATSVYPIVLLVCGSPDPGTLAASYLGTLFLASCYVSMGVLFSAMTENQIVAGALTFACGLFFWLVNWAAQSAGPVWGDFLDYLSLIQHYNNFSQGLIDTTDVIFFTSFIGLGLFFTHRVLDSYRWR